MSTKNKPQFPAFLTRGNKSCASESRAKLASALPSVAKTRVSKYHAQASGGYDSRREQRRANELRLMQRAKLISDLREQVSYELIPAQRDINGKVIERACAYIADFVYTDRYGNTVVEDTKGFRTKEYIIKRKLMLQVHGIRIHEV